MRLYELGNIYLPKELPLTELPDESMQFTLGMYGEGDFFTMKGVVEEFLREQASRGRKTYDPADKKPYLHPGRQADIVYERIKSDIWERCIRSMDNYGLEGQGLCRSAGYAEDHGKSRLRPQVYRYRQIPAVTRDISMLVPKTMLAGQIEDMIRQRGGKILEELQPCSTSMKEHRLNRAVSPWHILFPSAHRIRRWAIRKSALP